jgi:hypothetical protein
MSVPHELRYHIGGFASVDTTTEVNNLLEVNRGDAAFLHDLRSMGIDPAVLLAKQRLKQRKQRQILAGVVYRFVDLLYSTGNPWRIKVSRYHEITLVFMPGQRHRAFEDLVRKMPGITFDLDGSGIYPEYQYSVRAHNPMGPYDEDDLTSEELDDYHQIEADVDRQLNIDLIEADRLYRKLHDLRPRTRIYKWSS